MTMKKFSHLSTISSIIVLAFVIPQVAFAAWWNPISWFNGWSFFHRTDIQTQVLENRVKELEKRLENASTSVAVATTTTEQSQTTKRPAQTTPVANVGAKNTIPVVDAPVVKQSTPAQPTQPAKDYEKLYAELRGKYGDMRDITVYNAIIPLEELSSRTAIQKEYLAYLRDFDTSLNSDLNALVKLINMKPKPADTIDYYVSRFASLSSDFTAEKSRYQTNLAEEIAASQSSATSQAQIAKEENLRKVNMKLAELRGYMNEMSNAEIAKSMLSKITDLDGNNLFTAETTPYYNPYFSGQYMQAVFLVINRELTKLTVLQAQYQ